MTTDELMQQELERKQAIFERARPEIERMYLAGSNLPKIEAKFPDVDRRLLRTWAAVLRLRRSEVKERLFTILRFVDRGRYGYYLTDEGHKLVRLLSGAQEYWREDAERLGKKLPELGVKKEPAPKIASPAQVLRRYREATEEMEA